MMMGLLLMKQQRHLVIQKFPLVIQHAFTLGMLTITLGITQLLVMIRLIAIVLNQILLHQMTQQITKGLLIAILTAMEIRVKKLDRQNNVYVFANGTKKKKYGRLHQTILLTIEEDLFKKKYVIVAVGVILFVIS
jgi:hypothetical protein